MSSHHAGTPAGMPRPASASAFCRILAGRPSESLPNVAALTASSGADSVF
jgi:hypothetical protein